ncbi:hypothetical protein BKG68_20725 [Mycobacteroides saopaulense]|uniref:Uncharacterized protein n=1 Tax=Mycobacteroides saopaulense TaxID=1578165 RepID=A0ABX3BTQ8_9MYCO|nr:hypothetical protein BKG68_20725 [Mycobacteroides saopaulense]OHU01808.1 hypothetical protein BKG73_24365 [Mycobacteroides saopaulense]
MATVRILDERYYSTEDVRPLPDTDDGTAALVAHKQMPLDALHVEAMSHRVLAAQQGVIYDGWGTSLVGATPEPGGV